MRALKRALELAQRISASSSAQSAASDLSLRCSQACIGPSSERLAFARTFLPSIKHQHLPPLPPQPHYALLLSRSMAEKAGQSLGHRQPVSLQGLILALMAGAAGIWVLRQYKDEKIQQVMTQSQQVVGKASVGGPFKLIDYDGKRFTDRDLRGEFALLYFGFTHCPDICPDELEKVAAAITEVDKKLGVLVRPVFISVDPERDTPGRIKSYVKDFHPQMLGLTGDLEDVKKTSKAYRVYFSKTGEAGAKDYLVDHSIIHYLIDPDGEFVTFYGKNYTADQMAQSLSELVTQWQASHPEYHPDKKLVALAPPAKAAT